MQTGLQRLSALLYILIFWKVSAVFVLKFMGRRVYPFFDERVVLGLREGLGARAHGWGMGIPIHRNSIFFPKGLQGLKCPFFGFRA